MSDSTSIVGKVDTTLPISNPKNGRVKELSIRLGDVTKDNWQQLRRLNLAILPVQYSDKFYKDTFKEDVKPVTKLAYHNDILVGAVCCRIESSATSTYLSSDSVVSNNNINNNLPGHSTASTATSPPIQSGRRIYIMTLGVLAPYRGYGIGSKLLKLLLDFSHKTIDITELFLHVQTSNDDALNFYKRFGFEILATIPNYYKRIEPSDCFLVSRKFTH